ncbi:alpha-L-fucosidase [Luteolibacter pohnpeiensis]|uniref:alpha-L-fucosidase n=1 Tax=Luteolibacter pohnpeiensis TaxID=454153 RepID=A0A934S7E7_9BACT|nr:alpha-L-fucosidase [Luteolibacter pohnpeiensis]MBK1884051.1 alpha-L-fucosidase [Luteolibacter pohnpeiensis]
MQKLREAFPNLSRRAVAAGICTGLMALASTSAAVEVEAIYHLGENETQSSNRPTDSSGKGRNFSSELNGGSVQISSEQPPFGSTRYYTFNGTNQGFYDVNYNAPENNIGIEAWVKIGDLTQSDRTIFSTGGNEGGLQIAYNINAGGLCGALAGKTYVGKSYVPSSTSEWVHVALVRDAGTTTFYVNGVAWGDSNTSIPNDGSVLHLAVNSGAGAYFKGAVDEVRIFSFEAGTFDPHDLLWYQSPTADAPRFLEQPKDFAVREGGIARLTAEVAGGEPLNYQWIRDADSAVVGSDAILDIPAFSANLAGAYHLKVSNALGEATSSSANLSITPYQEPEPATVPSKFQQAQIDRKYGLFCHFGINTFLDQEWSDGSASATRYAPTAIDADQWVMAAKEAGMRYFILTTKHHDGFCLWDSKWTTYDVGASGNTTDVVKAVSDACRRHGLKFAIYYSFWDRHEPSYRAADFSGYITYMKNQLTELLTNYGPVCEIWFDGAWDRPAEDWKVPEIYDLVKSLQPECQITVNRNIGLPGLGLGSNDIHPTDQKEGDPIRFFPTDFRTHDPEMPAFPDNKLFQHGAELYYLPFEATVTMSPDDEWFYHPDQLGSKSLRSLERYFDIATAQNNILVFNAPPDRNGRLLDSNVATLKELAYRLGLEPGRPFPKNLAEGATASASSVWDNNTANWGASFAIDENPDSRWAAASSDSTSSWLELDFGAETVFDRVILNEYLENGVGRAKTFELDAWSDGEWQSVHQGTTIGESLRVDLSPVTTSKLRLKILTSSGPVSISMLKIQNSSKPDPSTSSYKVWQQQGFSTADIEQGLAEPDHSPGGDGVPNVMKFALGITQPKRPVSSEMMPKLAMEDGATFSFFRATQDAVYQVEQSQDLLNWEELITNPGEVGQMVQVRIADDEAGANFVRLWVNTDR